MNYQMLVPDVHKIEHLRQNRGWTKEYLAEVSGVTSRTLGRFAAAAKTGDAAMMELNCTFKTVNAIAEAFGVPGISLVKEVAD